MFQSIPQRHPGGRRLAEATHHHHEPLLVSLLDGTVRAVDARTGETMWSFDSGGPLVRAHGSPTGADSTGGVAIRPTSPVVFPGVDGSLYAYGGESSSSDTTGGEVSRLPVTARQLVEASPSMTKDGGVVMGTRRSTVFAVDRHTGELLRSFDTDGTVVHGDEGFFVNGAGQSQSDDSQSDSDSIFIGRTEYVVRSVDSSSGRERWNVTYGELTPLTSSGPGAGTGGHEPRAAAVPPPGPRRS